MGNNRFRLSDMIPNAWFYKLKDNMSRSKKRNGSNHVVKKKKNKAKATSSPTTTTTSQRSHSNYSHCFSIEPNSAGKYYNSPIYTKHSDTLFTDSPRRSSSSRRRGKRKTIYKPSPPTLVSSPVLETWSFHSANNWTNLNPNPKPNHVESPEYFESSPESKFDGFVSSESECDDDDESAVCRVSSSTNDIIIDMNSESFAGKAAENQDRFDAISQLGLAPILTKPVRFDDKVIEAIELRSSTMLDVEHAHHPRSQPAKISKEERSRARRERKTSPIAPKSSANSAGIKLRVNSPKLASRKAQAYARRSVSSGACKASKNAGIPEGFAVVKSSVDPQKDFRESMVEMIMENNIRASKDLENLLACYLSLNSSEYHDLIVKAFEQIWYDMAQLKL